MATGAKRKRMGWLGLTAAFLGILALAIGALVWWALSSNAVGLLDWVDARFDYGRDAELAVMSTYGDHPAQKFELFEPGGAAPAEGFPLVVFIHGGGWRNGDPHDYRFIARTMAGHGYATALVGYRLRKDGRFPNMLLDSAAGVRAALDAAAGTAIDRSRIALMGHSAGAFNVSMLTLDPKWLRDARVDPGVVKGTVVLAGPADFYPFDKSSSQAAMGHWPRPEETQPINYVAASGPPLLLVHGDRDDVVRPRNSLILGRKLSEVGRPTKPVIIDGMGHNGLIITLARPFDRDERVGNAVFGFLGKVLAASGTSSPVKPATS